MRRLDARSVSSFEVARPKAADLPLDAVREIIERVRSGGDQALIDLTSQFDGVKLEPRQLRVSNQEIESALRSASPEFTKAVEQAISRLRAFGQRQALVDWEITVAGGRIGETVRPVDRAGAYVPGGRASYPSSVLMCAVPAGVAGVAEMAFCIPPGADGMVAQASLAAAALAGVREVYRIGGAQAIAAMAFGTETVRRTDVIVGPGNVFVALAKREVAGIVGIDSVAGPSEIAIVADAAADPVLLAMDLIAQAEHGPNGSFLLITWDEDLLDATADTLARKLDSLEASVELRSALSQGAAGVLVADEQQALDVVNGFAPEHLELVYDGAEKAVERVRHAGAIFIGRWSPVSLGDYLAGTNHVLPTAGAARWASGLRTSHFQKASAVVQHTRESLGDSLDALRTFASVEGLPIHARAAESRFES